jgi:hypothetical protein
MTKKKLLRDRLHTKHRKRARRWRSLHENEVYIKDANGKYHWSARKKMVPDENLYHIEIKWLEE